MKADEYVRLEMAAGRLTHADVAKLVEFFQRHNPVNLLVADGKPGPATRAAMRELWPESQSDGKTYPSPREFPLGPPLPILGDRRPVITSEFRTASRPSHSGVDLFYPWRAGDAPSRVGDGLAAGKRPDGTPMWVIPDGTYAIAVASGVVTIAGDTRTGHRLWIDHRNGLRTGYFHLKTLNVVAGEIVSIGKQLGLVGDNPVDGDARHLHFELSPTESYSPIDPKPYLTGLGKWGDR